MNLLFPEKVLHCDNISTNKSHRVPFTDRIYIQTFVQDLIHTLELHPVLFPHNNSSVILETVTG